MRYQPNDYATGELVAVKLSTVSGGNRWFRAAVLESIQMEGEIDAAPNVNLRLLDLGLHVTKTTLDIVPLPTEFCQYPSSVRKLTDLL